MSQHVELPAAPDILLHHAVPTRSCRVAWLLEELNLPYKTQLVDFPTETRSAGYRQCNVAGMCVPRIPYMEDGDIKLHESLAIMTYILERYGNGKLAPTMADSPKARAEYLQMMQIMEADVTSPATQYGLNTLILPEDKRVAAIAEAGQKRCTEWLGILETKLSDGRAYIAGDEFTAADIVAGQGLHLTELIGLLDATKHPKCTALLTKLKARPAYEKVFNPAK